MIKPEDVRVRVDFSPGYEKDVTDVCISVLEQMDRQRELEAERPKETA
jgi:hypothetical protein